MVVLYDGEDVSAHECADLVCCSPLHASALALQHEAQLMLLALWKHKMLGAP